MTNTDTAHTATTSSPPHDSDSSHITTQPSHTNPLTKLTSALKSSLPGRTHSSSKKEEPSPALQEAIQKMEERKANKVAELQAEGKDTRALSGKRRNQVEFSPGEGMTGVLGGVGNLAG